MVVVYPLDEEKREGEYSPDRLPTVVELGDDRDLVVERFEKNSEEDSQEIYQVAGYLDNADWEKGEIKVRPVSPSDRDELQRKLEENLFPRVRFWGVEDDR